MSMQWPVAPIATARKEVEMVSEIQQRIVSASNLEFRGLERNKCLLPSSQRELARKAIASATHRRFVKALSRRSVEHTSELQSLMRISYAVFCLKNTKKP